MCFLSHIIAVFIHGKKFSLDEANKTKFVKQPWKCKSTIQWNIVDNLFLQTENNPRPRNK